MSGSLTVPNLIGAQPGPTIQAALFDQNWAAQDAYINTREVTFGLLAARPAPGVAGRYYMATDQNGGTFYGDNGSAWVQLASAVVPPAGTVAGTIVAAQLLLGSRSGVDYSTTSAAYVDVDAVNLKTSLTVPVGAKWAFVWATYSVAPSVITDATDHVQIFGAGVPMVVTSFTNNALINPVGQRSVLGFIANPASGVQTFALQFRGDGANSFSISAPPVEGTTGGLATIAQAMMLVVVTS
jgi:hypothetical protein